MSHKLALIDDKRGGLSLNHGYSRGNFRAYTPVLRNPGLFHQNTVLSSPTNYAANYVPPLESNYYYYPSPYSPQAQYIVPSPMNYSPQLTFSSYSMPAYSYAPTVSSKGLALILIATLILVALDLIIVRPQKLRSEVRSHI